MLHGTKLMLFLTLAIYFFFCCLVHPARYQQYVSSCRIYWKIFMDCWRPGRDVDVLAAEWQKLIHKKTMQTKFLVKRCQHLEE